MVDIHRILSSEKESGHRGQDGNREECRRACGKLIRRLPTQMAGVILLKCKEDVQTKKLIPIGIKKYGKR